MINLKTAAFKMLNYRTQLLIALPLVLGACFGEHQSLVEAKCTVIRKELESQNRQLIEGLDDGSPTIESALNPINQWLIHWDNGWQWMGAAKTLSDGKVQRDLAAQCLVQLHQSYANWVTQEPLVDAVTQLDLIEAPTSTQHFANKLRQSFREFGSGQTDEQQQNIAEGQLAVMALQASNWVEQAEGLRQQYQVLADSGGYSDLLTPVLSQQMMTSVGSLESFLEKYTAHQNTNETLARPSVLASYTWEECRQGLFKLSEKLFGIELIPTTKNPPYFLQDSVNFESFQVFENGQMVGELLFDIRWQRSGTDTLTFHPLQRGVTEIQHPVFLVAGKLTSLGETKSVSHSQLVQVLHQFGHFLHQQMAREQQWFLTAGLSAESDFVEIPAVLLEQWAWSEQGLQFFRSQPLNGDEKILLEATRQFNAAQSQQQLLAMAFQSYQFFHDANGSQQKLIDSISETPRWTGSHRHCIDEPLLIYRCLLAEEIVKKLIVPFREFGMNDAVTARKLRDTILGKGGSRPAVDMISDYLGESFTVEDLQPQNGF